MSRRDNFLDTLNHIEPNNIIMDLGGNPLSSMEGKSMGNILKFLGYKTSKEYQRMPFGKVRRIDERILKHFDIDTRSIGEIIKPTISQYKEISHDEYIDEWGIKRRFNGLYWDIIENPLKDASMEDLDHYQWPDGKTLDQKQLEKFQLEAKYLFENTDYIVCAEHPVYGIFELGCWLCGFDNFLIKLMIEQDFIIKLFDKIFEYQKDVIKEYYSAVGQYIHYTSSGDDFATQNSLFVSPDLFRHMIKPYLSERIRLTKKMTNAAFLHHSCGSVYKIIDDLIDCGVDILNPIQPEAADMHPAKLKDTFGDRIVFHGGIGTQEELLHGTKDSIEEYVKTTISIMNKQGGYIFAAAHNIQEDIPPQNIVYMFEAAKKFGRKTR